MNKRVYLGHKHPRIHLAYASILTYSQTFYLSTKSSPKQQYKFLVKSILWQHCHEAACEQLSSNKQTSLIGLIESVTKMVYLGDRCGKKCPNISFNMVLEDMVASSGGLKGMKPWMFSVMPKCFFTVPCTNHLRAVCILRILCSVYSEKVFTPNKKCLEAKIRNTHCNKTTPERGQQKYTCYVICWPFWPNLVNNIIRYTLKHILLWNFHSSLIFLIKIIFCMFCKQIQKYFLYSYYLF